MLALSLAAPACAADAPCPESNADECTRFTHIMAGMDSSDIATQLESIHAATQDLEPYLRGLVIDKALKSNNARLRTAAVRYTIKAHSNLDVSLELPVHPTPGQQELYARQSALTLRSIAGRDGSIELPASIELT